MSGKYEIKNIGKKTYTEHFDGGKISIEPGEIIKMPRSDAI